METEAVVKAKEMAEQLIEQFDFQNQLEIWLKVKELLIEDRQQQLETTKQAIAAAKRMR